MNESSYSVKRLRPFRVLCNNYEEPGIELVKEVCDLMIYEIGNADLAAEALSLEIVEVYSSRDMPVLHSPDELRDMIESVIRNVYDNGHVEYMIKTTRGTITFKTAEMLKVEGWKVKLYDDCMVTLNFILKTANNAAEWQSLCEWIRINAVDKSVVTESQDDISSDIIMAAMRTLDIVEDRDDMNDTNILHEHGVYLARSSVVKEAVEGCGYKFSSATYKVLEKHLLEPSRQRRINGVRLSIWAFDPWSDE